MVGGILNTNGDFVALDEFKLSYSLKTIYIIYQGVINAVKKRLNKLNIQYRVDTTLSVPVAKLISANSLTPFPAVSCA